MSTKESRYPSLGEVKVTAINEEDDTVLNELGNEGPKEKLLQEDQDKETDALYKANQIGRYRALALLILANVLSALLNTLEGYSNHITSYFPDAEDKSTSTFSSVTAGSFMFGNIIGMKVVQARFKWWHPRMQFVIVFLLVVGKEFVGLS